MIQLPQIIIKHCEHCGAPIDRKYKYCYKCFTGRRVVQTKNGDPMETTFVNRCSECGKPIERKYTKCYSCHTKETEKQ